MTPCYTAATHEFTSSSTYHRKPSFLPDNLPSFRCGHLPAHGRDVNKSIVLLNLAVFLFILVGLWAIPSGNFVLVVTHPSAPPSTVMSIISAADGAYVRASRYPWISVAYSEKPGYPARLRAAGASLVINNLLAAGCLQEKSS